MPAFLIAFGTWLGAQILALVTWFTTQKGIAFLVISTMIAAIGLAMKLLLATVDSTLASLAPSAIDFATPFIPSNFSFCINALISTHVACVGYKLAVKFAEYKSRILV